MDYKLVYTPRFSRDLSEVLDYLSVTLQNPIAANAFLDELEKAVLSVSKFPLAAPPYPSKRPRPLPYYHIRVKNYLVFYVVMQDTVEFRRLLYARADLPSRLEE